MSPNLQAQPTTGDPRPGTARPQAAHSSGATANVQDLNPRARPPRFTRRRGGAEPCYFFSPLGSNFTALEAASSRKRPEGYSIESSRYVLEAIAEMESFTFASLAASISCS